MSIRQSFVFSVSLGKGCYRHIRVPANYSLDQLAGIILWAFGFGNDHAHAFFMDNRVWSRDDAYYMVDIDMNEEYRHTCDYYIYQLGLQKGDAFKVVFDFGEYWKFQCKVLRSESVSSRNVELLRSVGTAPKLCPDYTE